MANDRLNGETEETPLERYLKKHRMSEPGVSTVASGDTSGDTQVDASVPHEIPLPPPTGAQEGDKSGDKSQEPRPVPFPDFNVTAAETVREAGGFWPRSFAWAIDAIILNALTTPFYFFLPFSMAPFALFLQGGSLFDLLGTLTGFAGLAQIIRLLVGFFYYGWFYQHKGATIGKMLLELEVIDSKTGRHIGYWHTFARESLMKNYVSGWLTLGMGYSIAAFRDDKRALHDLVCSTRVVRAKTKIF